nr:MAG TPA: hypothetical protein [Caudoviricetes sp.]
MEDRSTGMSWIAVLFVIIVIFAIFGGNFGGGWGWNRGNNPYPPQEGCNRVSNCEIERQEIADTARTQYLIEQQSNDTRMAINASTDAITSQASRIYEQRLQETIFDLKMENQSLKNGIFTKEQTDALAAKISDCCCGFNRRLDAIEGRMLTKPNLYGVASTCGGQIIPATCNGSGNI